MKHIDLILLIASVTFLIVSILFVGSNPIYSILISILIALPAIYIRIRRFMLEEELEDRFPLFLRDLSHYISIGQSLPVALRSLKENDYGVLLNRELRKIIAEMSVGVPFTEALARMEKRINSPKVKKAIISIIEAERYGGKIEYAFTAMSEALQELIDIKKERISKIRSFMINYYMVYVGFMAVIVITAFLFEKFFKTGQNLIDAFKQVSMILAILNGILTGIVIGKVSMGKISAGILHSVILVSIGLLILSII